MDAAVGQNRHVLLGAALVTVGAVAVSPVLPVTSVSGMVAGIHRAVRLVNNGVGAVADGAIAGLAASGADASGSIFNVPLNLFQQLVNVPYNEIWAMSILGNSLISSGPWAGASATNIWGEDPGDPLHFMGVVDMLFPFKAISGIGMAEPGVGNDGAPFDPSAAAGLHPGDFGYVAPFSMADAADGHLGLSQQVTLLMDELMPVNAATDADNSIPIFPPSEITGNANFDKTVWFLSSALGIQKFPYFTNIFQQLPHASDGSYTFPTITPENANTIINGTYTGNYDPSQPISLTNIPPDAQGMIDPSKGVGVGGQVPDNAVFQTAGTHYLVVEPGQQVPAGVQTEQIDMPNGYTFPDGTTIAPGDTAEVVLNSNGNPINLMPWEGMQVQLNFLQPFASEFNSLTAPVGSDYFSGFQIPTFEEVGRAFQTLIAGYLIAFDPFVPPGLLCATSTCDLPPAMELPALIKDLDQMWPGNTSIEEWLKLYGQSAQVDGGSVYGMANGITNHQVTAEQGFNDVLNSNYDGGVAVPYQINAQGVPVDAQGNPLPMTPELQHSIDFQQQLDTPSHFPVSSPLQSLIDAAHASGMQDFFQHAASGGASAVDLADTPAPALAPDLTPGLADLTGAMADAHTPGLLDGLVSALLP